MAIYVGQPAIDRGDSAVNVNLTILLEALVALASGTITQIESYWANRTVGQDLYVGLFYNIGGSNWKCRSAANLGPVNLGYNITTGLNLAVEIDDILGYWNGPEGAGLDKDTGSATLYIADNQCIVSNEASFANYGARILSIYGTGGEVAVGTLGKTAHMAAKMMEARAI